ncbi:DUF4279 domain-containing protein [Lusitaniella coriacea LEGE 07157]|uniref:DUF4279 domain-containing protein n=1 Tax=Lusitaniella coriacea LEGE 07157 TaxID=945747 RepID=A0A8J7DZF2_9CYAN|nr:DUF4279 domain-containing protein [Lusitaniella coriacea]MBE9118167.1 DUF4279 domain-containing protein [Lusitaniella coriacea LEGE 07157]
MTNLKNSGIANNLACKTTCLSITIVGHKLNPDEITRILKIEPTRGYSKVSVWHSHGFKRERKMGHWSFDTKFFLESTSVEKHARFLLERFEEKSSVLQSLCERYSVVISIWWELWECYGGFSLDACTLQRLSQLCKRVDFYLISFFDEDENEQG